MAEILIKAQDAFSKDAVKNAGLYKRGDPVVAVRDGHEWGDMEQAPKFWRVRIEGAASHIFEPFCHPIYRGIWTPDGEASMVLRRRWNFMPELLAPARRMTMFRGDVLTLGWDDWLRCAHDKSQERARGVILRAA